MTIKRKNRNIVVISAYAPTLEISTKHPEKCELFYDELDALIQTVSARDLLVIAGDFKAKTGSAYKNNKTVMGRFGKGQLNDNGIELIDFCSRNELVLTNTVFQHKINHRTTWQSPATPNRKAKDGNSRRNPVRNQIDYVIVRKCDMNKVSDSRSYSGTQTCSDHRLVLTTINETITLPKRHINEKKPDYSKLRNPEYSNVYKTTVLHHLNSNKSTRSNTQDKWSNIVKANHKAAEEILKNDQNSKHRSSNPEIIQLSKEQKELNTRIHNSKNDQTSTFLRKQRNRKLTRIHNLLKADEAERINDEIECIEKSKNNAQKMYQAIRILQRKGPKTMLLINCEDGITTNEHKQVQKITWFFSSFFIDIFAKNLSTIKPCKMKDPFTTIEIIKAISSMKNNKAPGIDQLKTEQLKYGPQIVPSIIAEILNESTETGSKPREISNGILLPLQKAGKKQGPCSNLRPIILFSVLRKILAICLINRIELRVLKHLPKSQAAYQSGRSTTEHVFAWGTSILKT